MQQKEAKQKMPKYDIVGKKKFFFTFSIIITIIGIIGYFINGLQYDIQFSGGTAVQIEMADSNFKANKAVDLVKKLYNKNATAYKLKTYNPDNNKKQINILKVQISKSEGVLSSKQFSELLDQLNKSKDFNVKKNPNMQVQHIQPAMGEELRNNGFLAVAVSSIMVAFYIAIRFKLMSGMAAGVTAVLALLHDVFIMMSVYAVFKIPINDVFIAAILTIIGYSVNDTIVIYDRIRENMTRLRRSNVSELVNISIVQTLARSINTVVTVLICVITLYIFATIYNIESIQQFSFPLIIGVTSGAYSSICIASPLWIIWMNLKEKNKSVKRKAKRA
jgi:preprotein translocase subunit SecF